MDENSRSGPPNAAQLLSAAAKALPLSEAIEMWLGARWSALLELDEASLQDEADRAKLCLMKASASFRLGDFSAASARISEAYARGGSRPLADEMLLAMMYDTLGCIASCLGDETSASEVFTEAIRPFEGRLIDLDLAARHRQISELAQMGLLTMGQRMLLQDHAKAKRGPDELAARLALMRTQIDLLGHELAIALRRGQIMAPAAEDRPPEDGLERRSVSQLGQDLWVLRNSGFKRNGFFVEFGATDGVRLSNTFILENEFAWKGICAEPNPALFEQLQRNRNCLTVSDCIGGQTGQEVEFVLADAFGGIADYAFADQHAERRQAFRTDGHVMLVTTISLNDFLRKYGAPHEIDYLSIDTEGSEYEILSHFPFDQWRIRLITVEHNGTPMRDRIAELLEGLGYRRTEAGFDDWYVLENSESAPGNMIGDCFEAD